MAEYFPTIRKIRYEGPKSKNPYSFKYYNPDETVDGKPLREHLRFAMAYWHTMTGSGLDMFGPGTALRPFENGAASLKLAEIRMNAAFEFMQKCEIDYWCFHDRDIAPEGGSLAEYQKNLDHMANLAAALQKETGKKLLWGTSNLFGNPRFMHGAATSPNAHAFAYAAACVKKAMELTHMLGGVNYVFWGGREGYETLLNTDMARELDHLAKFFSMAVDYAKEIGFTGQFLIEPKPKEPTKHQYDYDAANVVAFLRRYGLEKYFKLNIEANHATLAGHTFQHELAYARINGMLGSIDANRGDPLLGWDTDQFPTDIYDATFAMIEVIKNGGLHSGGLNFDAKVRRGSHDTDDLFFAHISGMDTFARAYKIAQAIVKDGVFDEFVKDRYASYDTGIGERIESGKAGFNELAEYALSSPDVTNASGRQEMLESILNQYILG